MGKNLLTPKQKQLLGLISEDKIITRDFYLTGGTALSYFYFKHRFSEDLDFFCQKEISSKALLTSISKIGDLVKPKKIEMQSLNKQEIFYFYFGSKSFVKLDFAHFPFDTLGKFVKFNNLSITSVEDITINKVHALINRKRARDYFDLCLCMKKLKWDGYDLIKNYRLKFEINLPIEQLATNFINVLDAEDLPIFVKKEDFNKTREFFLKEADKLKKDIIS